MRRQRGSAGIQIRVAAQIVEHTLALAQLVERRAQLPLLHGIEMPTGEGGMRSVLRDMLIRVVRLPAPHAKKTVIAGFRCVLYHVVIDRLAGDGEIAAADGLDGTYALAAQNALDTLDGISLAIEQGADALEKLDICRAVVATSATAL